MSIEKDKIFYLALDPERATGVEDILSDYAIVCPYRSVFTDALETHGTKMFILERDCADENWQDNMRAGTYGMMKLACVQNFIAERERATGGSDPPRRVRPSSISTPHILVLKTSGLIEKECRKNGWRLLAPRADLAKLFEDKITQYQNLGDGVEFPPTVITTFSRAAEDTAKMPFPLIAQFNIGHSGGGTFILQSTADLAPFIKKFPNREVRIAQFIAGNTYTLNALAAKDGAVYTGSISKQLTGLPEATTNPSSTVGNDFGVVPQELSAEQIKTVGILAGKVGIAMHARGYNGLFGIDVIAEKNTGKIYLVEVNTHQPASISFEAKIHRAIGKTPLILLLIRDMLEEKFEPKKEDLPPLVLRGKVRQVLYRNKLQKEIAVSEVQLPHAENIIASRMKLIKPNEELYRIQTIIF